MQKILLTLVRGTIIKKLMKAKRTMCSINRTLRALGLPEVESPPPKRKVPKEKDIIQLFDRP